MKTGYSEMEVRIVAAAAAIVRRWLAIGHPRASCRAAATAAVRQSPVRRRRARSVSRAGESHRRAAGPVQLLPRRGQPRARRARSRPATRRRSGAARSPRSARPRPGRRAPAAGRAPARCRAGRRQLRAPAAAVSSPTTAMICPPSTDSAWMPGRGRSTGTAGARPACRAACRRNVPCLGTSPGVGHEPGVEALARQVHPDRRGRGDRELEHRGGVGGPPGVEEERRRVPPVLLLAAHHQLAVPRGGPPVHPVQAVPGAVGARRHVVVAAGGDGPRGRARCRRASCRPAAAGTAGRSAA